MYKPKENADERFKATKAWFEKFLNQNILSRRRKTMVA